MSSRDLRGPIAWMTRHGVAPNILMAFMILGGLYMSTKIKKEVFPNFLQDSVTIMVPFPGASPEEVEEGVVLAIEEAVRGLDGVEEVHGIAAEGNGSVSIDIIEGSDHMQVYQDVQQAVERIRVFPEEAEKPTITLDSRRRSVMELQIYGDIDEWSLRQAAETVRDALIQTGDVTQVELVGARDLEIHIEIPQATLREYGLSLSEVGQILRQSALDRSGGRVETGAGEILLRVDERRDWAREFHDIPIIATEGGSVVRLGEIANISEGFQDTDTFATFDGKRAIGLTVFRVGDQTPISVSEAVMRTMPLVLDTLPPGLSFGIEDDDSEIYRQRLELLLKNGFMGLCLVLLTLSIFLEFKLAFWVAAGIPTAFLGTLLFLPGFDISINMISMFAFILALGIVVDDAIVAGENIYEYRQRGLSNLDAAIQGARDMAVPISFSILTNIVAFIPLMFIPGPFGKIWAVIPPVVATAFVLSWIEALFILPAHLAIVKEGGTTGLGSKLHAVQQMISRASIRFAEKGYGPVVHLAIRWRYVTIALMLVVLCGVLSIPMSGRMAFLLMPQVESEYSQVTATLPVGAPLADTESVRDRLIEAAKSVVAGNGGEDLAKGVFALVKENVIEVRIYLVEATLRTLSTAQVTTLWRECLGGEIPGLETLRFAADAGGPGRGPSVSVELSHRNVETLERASAALAERLTQFASVKDVDDGYTPGKVQLSLKATEEANSLNLDAEAIARHVRGSFFGVEAIRQQRGRNEITVRVRLPENERTSEADIEHLLLPVGNDGEVPLLQIAEVERGRAYTNITRRNGRRIVTTSANIEPVSETTNVLAELEADVMPAVIADFPGLSYSFEGRQADMRDSLQSFYYTCTIALFLIFVLLSIPFRSYLQPLIVMTAIPFAIVGAILGHLLMGFSLSLISVMGIIALAGVVINSALVMIDYANLMRAEGKSAEEAISQAGIRRFRPIILTTATTFLGLAPMIFEPSRQARFLIPMALSLGYGIVFATAVTLVLIPALYMVLEDLSAIARLIWHPKHDTEAASKDGESTSTA